MNKNLFYILVTICLLCSCDKKEEVYVELTKTLINNTESHILYAVKTEIAQKDTLSLGYDSVELSFAKNIAISLPAIGPYAIVIDEIQIKEEVLYNISDTSCFKLNFNTNSWTAEDYLFNEAVSTNYGGEGLDEIRMDYIRFNETLKTIMQKDYSMLEKFPEYYK